MQHAKCGVCSVQRGGDESDACRPYEPERYAMEPNNNGAERKPNEPSRANERTRQRTKECRSECPSPLCGAQVRQEDAHHQKRNDHPIQEQQRHPYTISAMQWRRRQMEAAPPI